MNFIHCDLTRQLDLDDIVDKQTYGTCKLHDHDETEDV